MSDSWIKVRTSLLSHPKVRRLAVRLGVPRVTVLGCLQVLWSVADLHADGNRLDDYDADLLDAEVEVQGFAEALASVGWLVLGDDYVELPSYQEHNGGTAKTRAQTAKRVRKHRGVASADPPERSTVTDADDLKRTSVTPVTLEAQQIREEEIREEPPNPPADGGQVSAGKVSNDEDPHELDDEPAIATPDQAAKARRRRGADDPPVPGSFPAALEAFNRWSDQPPPVGRGRPLATDAGEHRAVADLCHALAQRPPIPRGGEQVRPDQLIPQAVDALIARGKANSDPPFTAPKFAAKCVKNTLEDWANGVPDRPPRLNGRPQPISARRSTPDI